MHGKIAFKTAWVSLICSTPFSHCIDLIITKSNVLFRMFLFLEEKRKEKQKLRIEKMATKVSNNS